MLLLLQKMLPLLQLLLQQMPMEVAAAAAQQPRMLMTDFYLCL